MAKPFIHIHEIAPATDEDIRDVHNHMVHRIIENDIDDREFATPEAVKIIGVIKRLDALEGRDPDAR